MASQANPEPVANRHCGSCSMCCKLFDIDWLEKPKPAGAWCPHCKPGSGCSVWDTLPANCASFFCMWRRLPGLDDSWRPDRAGFVISQAKNASQWNVTVDPSRPQAWQKEPYRSKLTHVASIALENGEALILRIGRQQHILLPHTLVPVPTGAETHDARFIRGSDGRWSVAFERAA